MSLLAQYFRVELPDEPVFEVAMTMPDQLRAEMELGRFGMFPQVVDGVVVPASQAFKANYVAMSVWSACKREKRTELTWPEFAAVADFELVGDGAVDPTPRATTDGSPSPSPATSASSDGGSTPTPTPA